MNGAVISLGAESAPPVARASSSYARATEERRPPPSVPARFAVAGIVQS